MVPPRNMHRILLSCLLRSEIVPQLVPNFHVLDHFYDFHYKKLGGRGGQNMICLGEYSMGSRKKKLCTLLLLGGVFCIWPLDPVG